MLSIGFRVYDFEKGFELFGDRIAVIHAKDFVIENGEVKTTVPGKGLLNYPVLLKKIKEKKLI